MADVRCKQADHCNDLWWCKANAQCKKEAMERTRPTIQLARELEACPSIDYKSHAAALRRLEAENATLRRMLAVSIAGALLYADDGELQDNTSAPFIDFKRDCAASIEAKLRARFISASPAA